MGREHWFKSSIGHMDFYNTDWKAKADPKCDACKGYGVVLYQCRPENCFDYGIETGPCLKCLNEDYLLWKKDNPSFFEWD